MSGHIDRAREVREIKEPHYNCCQAVLVSFAGDCGLTEEQAFALGSHFGKGMFLESVCGAVTGGLMVLGMLGAGDREIQNEYYQAFKAEHEGCLECGKLLRMNSEKGGDKKTHCDGLIFECISLVEKLAGSRGLL